MFNTVLKSTMLPRIKRRFVICLILNFCITVVLVYITNYEQTETRNLTQEKGQKINNMYSHDHAMCNPESDKTQTNPTDESIGTMIERLKILNDSFFPKYFWNTTLDMLTRLKSKYARENGIYLIKHNLLTSTNWEKFHENIRQYSLYDPADPAVNGLLEDMATLPIIQIDEVNDGAELKYRVIFKDGGRAIMKLMRIPRTHETNPNIEITDDVERHFAEIAAFHLDKILGFYRVPPTTGRWINLSSEIRPLVIEAVNKTFYKSRAGNTCFTGKCRYWCIRKYPVCGIPDMVEVSLMSYVPLDKNNSEFASQPWFPLYENIVDNKNAWLYRDNFCDHVRQKDKYKKGKLLADIIDSSIFDFLIGNTDRHTYYFFSQFGKQSFPILFDNGRGFGNTEKDDVRLLGALRQCCQIRTSTLLKFVKLYTGQQALSGLMKRSLENDPVAPVLLKKHLIALDRRVIYILQTVAGCLIKFPSANVIVDDGF